MAPPVKLHPDIKLASFGQNLHGESVYRVVWGPSRLHQVGGAHHEYDGAMSSERRIVEFGRDPNLKRVELGYRWLPLYPGIERWVLERWLSPFEFTGMLQSRWEEEARDPATGMVGVPYPVNGEYEGCYIFPERPGQSLVELVIRAIEAGRRHSFTEKREALLAHEAAKEKEQSDRFEAAFHDAQPAGGHNAINLTPGRRLPEDFQPANRLAIAPPPGAGKGFTRKVK